MNICIFRRLKLLNQQSWFHVKSGGHKNPEISVLWGEVPYEYVPKKIKDRRITIFFLRFGIISLRVEMEVVEMSTKKEWVFRNGIYWLCSTVSGSSFFSSIWKECELVIKHFFSLPWRNTRLHAAPFWKLPWNLFFFVKVISFFWPSWSDEFFFWF